jgi:hypothetical protein
MICEYHSLVNSLDGADVRSETADDEVRVFGDALGSVSGNVVSGPTALSSFSLSPTLQVTPQGGKLGTRGDAATAG